MHVSSLLRDVVITVHCEFGVSREFVFQSCNQRIKPPELIDMLILIEALAFWAIHAYHVHTVDGGGDHAFQLVAEIRNADVAQCIRLRIATPL